MKRRFSGVVIATQSLFWATNSHMEELKTQASCSPVIDRTQGNVTVTFSGGCTVGITPAQLKDIIAGAACAIPSDLLDRYEMISHAFGVTDTAVTTFFRILGETKVATEDLDAKLREIAARHLTLLKQAEASPDDDPEVAAIKKQAVMAIGAGDYRRAEKLLQHAVDADLAVGRRAQDAASKRFLTTAKTRADLAELKLTELHFTTAVENFRGGRSGACHGTAYSSCIFEQARRSGAASCSAGS
jgi:hypothetical protein